jgi:L-histidine N-alpha-methyltransferase
MMNTLTLTPSLARQPAPFAAPWREPRRILRTRAARPVAPEALSAPATDAAFARDVLDGLSQRRKSIPCTWLYDERGSALFERITELDAYYPTRCERQILERCAASIAAAAGRHALLVELGSGSCRKTATLLDALDAPRAYLPVDISAQFLARSVDALRRQFPAVPMQPVVADFTRLHALPLDGFAGAGRRVVFFPGSTIGNFTPEAASALLDRVGEAVGRGALLVVGTDITHDPAVLLPAYDDPQRVTAAFDKNLLVRINRELGGNFSLDAFEHEARWDAERQRIEMHLVSVYTQRVTVLGRAFHFAMGESIHTENSYKFGTTAFQALAERAGWAPLQLWTDGPARFAVHVLERM